MPQTNFPDEHLFTITTPDKHHLAAVLHIPKKKVKGLVILSHGFTGNKSENSRLFVTTARELAKAGINIATGLVALQEKG